MRGQKWTLFYRFTSQKGLGTTGPNHSPESYTPAWCGHSPLSWFLVRSQCYTLWLQFTKVIKLSKSLMKNIFLNVHFTHYSLSFIYLFVLFLLPPAPTSSQRSKPLLMTQTLNMVSMVTNYTLFSTTPYARSSLEASPSSSAGEVIHL